MKQPIDYRGIAALMIASALSIGFAAGILGLVIWGRSVTQQGSEVLIAIGGAMIGMLAGWLTAARVNGHPPSPPPTDKDGET